MGAPYIDLRLWAQIDAAVRAEFSAALAAQTAFEEHGVAPLVARSNPAPLPSGAQSNEWELTSRCALALLQPPHRRG